MNIVTILFGWLMATLFGALFHLWRDGGFWKLLLYLGLSWAGFLVRELGSWRLGRQILISRGAKPWFGIDWQLDFPFCGSLG